MQINKIMSISLDVGPYILDPPVLDADLDNVREISNERYDLCYRSDHQTPTPTYLIQMNVVNETSITDISILSTESSIAYTRSYMGSEKRCNWKGLPPPFDDGAFFRQIPEMSLLIFSNLNSVRLFQRCLLLLLPPPHRVRYCIFPKAAAAALTKYDTNQNVFQMAQYYKICLDSIR